MHAKTKQARTARSHFFSSAAGGLTALFHAQGSTITLPPFFNCSFQHLTLFKRHTHPQSHPNLQVVVTDSLAVLRASTIHFGQYGLLVPLLRDPAALAVQAADWASAQVGGVGGGADCFCPACGSLSSMVQLCVSQCM